MKQLIVIEISSDTFTHMLESDELNIDDVVVLERYPQGEPEVRAFRKLRMQKEKDMNANYAAEAKAVEAMREVERSMLKKTDG
jgi:hypothetical protein